MEIQALFRLLTQAVRYRGPHRRADRVFSAGRFHSQVQAAGIGRYQTTKSSIKWKMIWIKEVPAVFSCGSDAAHQRRLILL